MIESDEIEFYDPREEAGKWSASSLKAIHSCGKQWWWRYKTDEKPIQTPYLAFGKTVHKVIETVHKENNFNDSFWEPLWNDLWHESSIDVEFSIPPKTHFSNLGAKIIGKYISANQDVNLLEVEREFPSEEETFRIGSYKFRGVVDQIRRTDGGRLLVVDLKTAKYPPHPLVLDADPQFSLYWEFARQKYGEDALLGLYHLQSGKILYTQRKERDIEKLQAVIEEGQQKINQEMFSRNVGEACKFCPYVGVCLGSVATENIDSGVVKEL